MATAAPKTPGEIVKTTQKKLDKLKLPWHVSWVERPDGTFFSASQRSSGQTCIHRDPEMLVELVSDAEKRLASIAPVQVAGGIASSTSMTK